MKKAIIFLTILFFATTVPAETIKLKSGKVIEGEIIEKTDDYVKIDQGEKVWKVQYRHMDAESEEKVKGLAVSAAPQQNPQEMQTSGTEPQQDLSKEGLSIVAKVEGEYYVNDQVIPVKDVVVILSELFHKPALRITFFEEKFNNEQKKQIAASGVFTDPSALFAIEPQFADEKHKYSLNDVDFMAVIFKKKYVPEGPLSMSVIGGPDETKKYIVLFQCDYFHEGLIKMESYGRLDEKDIKTLFWDTKDIYRLGWDVKIETQVLNGSLFKVDWDAKVDKIKEGMPLDEVVAVMGSAGTEMEGSKKIREEFIWEVQKNNQHTTVFLRCNDSREACFLDPPYNYLGLKEKGPFEYYLEEIGYPPKRETRRECIKYSWKGPEYGEGMSVEFCNGKAFLISTGGPIKKIK